MMRHTWPHIHQKKDENENISQFAHSSLNPSIPSRAQHSSPEANGMRREEPNTIGVFISSRECYIFVVNNPEK